VSHVLGDVAVLSWDSGTWKRGWHETVCRATNNNVWASNLSEDNDRPQYIERFYLNAKITAPDKFRLRVKDDIAHAFEHPKILAPLYPWNKVENVKFGHRIPAFDTLSDDQLPIWGTMCELVFTPHDFSFLLGDNVHFSDNGMLLDIVQDESLNRILLNDPGGISYHVCLSKIIGEDGPLAHVLTELMQFKRPKFVVPRAIMSHLDECRSETVPSASTCWNQAIIYDMVFSNVRNPMLYREFDTFSNNAAFAGVMANVAAFKKTLRDPILETHKRYTMTITEYDQGILTDMGVTDRTSMRIGIDGVSDFETRDCVYEIKAPVGEKFNNKWVIQPLMYACMRDPPHQDMCVVDVTNGVAYKYRNVLGGGIKPRSVVKKALMKFGHRHEHVAKIISKIAA
jgi:hypothetical protein